MTTSLYNSIGHYKVSAELGRGGMATVCLATDQRTGRLAALKLVPLHGDSEAADRLKAERYGADLQRQLSAVSEFVPQVYECFEFEPYFCIAMEYIAGENLSDLISGARLVPDRALAIAIALCRFLDTAHHFEATAGGRKYGALLHGDLKPRNVRIAPDGQVKVLDFGIAKALSLTRSVTRSDFHSLGYSSPERLESGRMDAHADLWAIGVICFEMLNGAPPFRAPSVPALEQQIRGRQVPPLSAAVPRNVRAVVGKLLAPTAAERYATAAAAREDLEACATLRLTVAEAEGWPRADETEATRRTQVLDAPDTEATRATPRPADEPPTTRTRQPEPDAGARQEASGTAAPESATAVTARTSTPRVAVRKPRRFLRRLAIAALIFGGLNEACVAGAASRVAARLPIVELADLNAAWSEYDALSERSWGAGVYSLGRRLTDKSRELAEGVFSNYRTPAPSVREQQWMQARDAMRRALIVSPGDRGIEAAIRYSEGHLFRINGEARLIEDKREEAMQEFSKAVTAFRQAAELRKDWPDPFLGLFRTFVKGLEDLDRGTDALAEARRLGYRPTDRETTLLGDGYRTRGNALYIGSLQLYGAPQEEDHLRRALRAHEEALRQYERVSPAGRAAGSIRASQRAVDRINARLAEIEAWRETQSETPIKFDRWP